MKVGKIGWEPSYGLKYPPGHYDGLNDALKKEIDRIKAKKAKCKKREACDRNCQTCEEILC